MAVTKRKTTKTGAEPVKAKAQRKKATDTTAKKVVAGTRTRRATKKTAVASKSADPAAVRHEIELLAYHLWEEHGRPDDSRLGDWAQAEQQVLASRGA